MNMEDFLLTLGWQMGFLFLPFFILGFLLHQIERGLSQSLQSIMGRKAILFTGWIGTPVHEFSHLILCPVFYHQVKEVKFFTFDEKSGTLGYVRHSYNPKSFYQVIGNFFIGVAPLFGGALCLWGLSIFLLPETGIQSLFQQNPIASPGDLFEAISSIFSGLWEAVFDRSVNGNWKFWVFVYLSLCVGSHLAPSKADFDGGTKGFFCFLFLVIGILSLLYFFGKSVLVEDFIKDFLSPLVLLLLFATVINFVLLLALKPLAFIRGR
jgi:hypothetical protein